MTKEQIISNVYYDLENGFGSIQETEESEDARRYHHESRCTKLFEETAQQADKKHRGSNSYTAPFARFEYQIDIMDMVPLTRNPETKIPKKKTEPRYAFLDIGSRNFFLVKPIVFYQIGFTNSWLQARTGNLAFLELSKMLKTKW